MQLSPLTLAGLLHTLRGWLRPARDDTHTAAGQHVQRQDDGADQIAKLSDRLLFILAACIGLPLLAHMVATSTAAAPLWQWLMS